MSRYRLRLPCLLDQVRGNHSVDNAQHLPHDRRPAGEQKAQLKGKTQYPLAHGLCGQDFIHQQGRALGHAPRPAARAKPAAPTTEGDEVLGVAGVAAYPQEAVLQPAALEVALEFALHVTRQRPALPSHVGDEP